MKKSYTYTDRLVVVDLIRIISVLMIFLFHSEIFIKCNYGILNDYINVGAIFMTSFFMLSGFTLFYVNLSGSGFKDFENIITFYKKRIISIMPLYWFTVFIYPIWDVIVNGGNLINNIILIPIEFLGLQQIFHSIFTISHNDATWFVSCFVVCYLFFPLLFELIKNIRIKSKILLGLVLGMILLYSPLLVIYLELENIYANICFRMFEFTIGILLCSIWLEIRDTEFYRKNFPKWWNIIFSFFILIVLITLGVKLFSIGRGYCMLYNWIALPIFSFLLICSAGINAEKMGKNKLFNYFIEISYAIFYAQFFVWYLTVLVMNLIGCENNIVKIVLSFSTCMVIGIIMHELIEKPFRRFIKKIVIKK